MRSVNIFLQIRLRNDHIHPREKNPKKKVWVLFKYSDKHAPEFHHVRTNFNL
jgi:hypothetical protein